MICAGYESGGVDSCQGDSGGPAFVSSGGSAVLIGVVSFGFGCAQAGYPGFYARISTLSGWVSNVMSQTFPPPSPPAPFVCSNTCRYANDNDCDDGGPGAEYAICDFATDCADCQRQQYQTFPPPSPPTPFACTDTCVYASDSDCDDGGPGSEYAACSFATDCTDCPRLPPETQLQLCECAADGVSGGVSTGRPGCGDHVTDGIAALSRSLRDLPNLWPVCPPPQAPAHT